jgi:protein ImuB
MARPVVSTSQAPPSSGRFATYRNPPAKAKKQFAAPAVGFRSAERRLEKALEFPLLVGEHLFASMTVGCLLIPRFSLLAALGERRGLLAEPAALAPDPGGEQVLGETSGAAEAFGVRAGISLAEALARCPRLVLIPPDPGRAEAEWERIMRRLERIGAAVEPGSPGEAFFGLDGLRGLCGPRPEDVLLAARRAIGVPARCGGGPTRFCAYAAAGSARVRVRRPPVVGSAGVRAFLAPRPVALLLGRLPGPPAERRRLVATLERLGVATLGELAELPRVAIADRFGRLGLAAQALAGGEDTPLQPRNPHEELIQALGLPEGCYGEQLGRALELLVERLLADPRRRGRTFRALRIEATLAGGGSWQRRIALRSPSADSRRLLLALSPRLEGLPAPASALALRALELGPEGAEQPALAPGPAERRRELIAEAVRQTRAAAGRDALLRVVEVDPDSRIPERRVMLAPYPEKGAGG